MQAAISQSNRKHIPAPLVTAVITVALWAIHVGVRETGAAEPGAPLRLAITGALIVAFASHVIVTARMMRQFDEFTRAVHMSAVAFAFTASLIVFFAIGFLRAEGLLGGRDPRDLAALMLVAYAAGLAWAWRRY